MSRPSSPGSEPELVVAMTRTELRAMLAEVVREEVSARRSKVKSPARKSDVIEVSEMDRAAARAAARRVGFIVGPAGGRGRR